jgi:hypothetical protein
LLQEQSDLKQRMRQRGWLTRLGLGLGLVLQLARELQLAWEPLAR